MIPGYLAILLIHIVLVSTRKSRFDISFIVYVYFTGGSGGINVEEEIVYMYMCRPSLVEVKRD